MKPGKLIKFPSIEKLVADMEQNHEIVEMATGPQGETYVGKIDETYIGGNCAKGKNVSLTKFENGEPEWDLSQGDWVPFLVYCDKIVSHEFLGYKQILERKAQEKQIHLPEETMKNLYDKIDRRILELCENEW